jgi:adenylate cyclase class 2
MYEVEFKLRASHEEIRPRLVEMDAEPLQSVVQEDTYYNAPNRDFTATDETLRVREQRSGETTSRLTYKGPLVDDQSKTREELETEIEDSETARAILTAVGFEPIAIVEKKREHFSLDGYMVTLDTVQSLGEFIEVETQTHEDEIVSARDGAQSLLVDLGLEPDAGIRTSYLDLILAQRDG